MEYHEISAMLQTLHERPIAYYKCYALLCKSVTAGVALSQIMYWWAHHRGEKFWLLDEQLRQETGLTERELRTAKQRLRALLFLTISRGGLPAKTYYEVNTIRLAEALSVQSSLDDSSKLEPSNRPNSRCQNVRTIYKGINETSYETITMREATSAKTPQKSRSRKTFFPHDTPGQVTLTAHVMDETFQAWALERGFEDEMLATEWERFTSKALANGYKYADWRRAFMNWLTHPEYGPKPTPSRKGRDLSQYKTKEGYWCFPGHEGHVYGCDHGTREMYCLDCDTTLGVILPKEE